MPVVICLGQSASNACQACFQHCCCLLQADVARKIKEECEAELAVAMPILEDALAALDTIKEADITYIRKLGNPPAAIKLVMEVMLPYSRRLIHDTAGVEL